MMSAQKLIIVSTRLPVSVSKINGKLVYKPSSGGLATGLSRVSEKVDNIWIGWPGIESDNLTPKEIISITKELKKYKCHPVFLNSKEVDDFYYGYCNATIWPLFHYFTEMVVYDKNYWQAYILVNQKFNAEARRFITKNSLVWVHDYQLMLLPEMLRQDNDELSIGFFLHIPFPSFEIFRLLPQRTEILNGLLGADLVGFHTYDYVRHFLSSVQRHLGHSTKLGNIEIADRTIKTDAFPIGIDYQKFAKNAQNQKVKTFAKKLDLLKRHKTILSVDRADYSKGIPARLDAFEKFIKSHPSYKEKVSFVLLAVPSRESVGSYQDLRSKIEQKVSRINGEYSTVNWTPIKYLYQSVDFNELTALYANSDVMLVTPLRDGMNLVAKEFIAAHHNKSGVLILSEMAGAASELQEAIQVNPNDYQMVADAIFQAIKMPVREQKERMKAMQDRIAKYDIYRWAEDFIEKLLDTSNTYGNHSKSVDAKATGKIIKAYNTANKRLILLDYDGTLKSFVNSPKKSIAYPTPRVRKVIKKLTDDKKNKVMVVSGRPKSSLDTFFRNKGLGLVAEHGGWIFDTGSWIKRSLKPKKWKKPIKQILDQFAERTPGAIVEVKDFAVVWHYRNVSPDLAFVRNEELKMSLREIINQYDIEIFEGSKILEIKPPNVHKGAIVSELIAKEAWDFILCIGDDYTDEDMFRVLPESAFSIHVGTEETRARFTISRVKNVVALLEAITDQ